jgi:hypothetical protein
VVAQVQNILPSAGGRMIFASLVPDDEDGAPDGEPPAPDEKRVKQGQ